VLRVLFYDPQAVITALKHVGSDLFAETITGAEILIDPNLHQISFPRRHDRQEEAGIP
jgi:hypothetical protein